MIVFALVEPRRKRAAPISFFNGRDFHDFDDLKAQLAHWSTNIDDERPERRKQHRTPLELHAEEQPHLIARPRHAYDTARVVYHHFQVIAPGEVPAILKS